MPCTYVPRRHPLRCKHLSDRHCLKTGVLDIRVTSSDLGRCHGLFRSHMVPGSIIQVARGKAKLEARKLIVNGLPTAAAGGKTVPTKKRGNLRLNVTMYHLLMTARLAKLHFRPPPPTYAIGGQAFLALGSCRSESLLRYHLAQCRSVLKADSMSFRRTCCDGLQQHLALAG